MPAMQFIRFDVAVTVRIIRREMFGRDELKYKGLKRNTHSQREGEDKRKESRKQRERESTSESLRGEKAYIEEDEEEQEDWSLTWNQPSLEPWAEISMTELYPNRAPIILHLDTYHTRMENNLQDTESSCQNARIGGPESRWKPCNFIKSAGQYGA